MPEAPVDEDRYSPANKSNIHPAPWNPRHWPMEPESQPFAE